MKVALLVLVVAVSAWLLWPDSDPAVVQPQTQTRATQPHTQQPRTRTQTQQHPTHRLGPIAPAFSARSLKPQDDQEDRFGLREPQQKLWDHLRKFASDAKLTDAQWERFERDLAELAAIEGTARLAVDRAGEDFSSMRELNAELGLELEARCADHMSDQQLAVLRRYRAWGLISRVRQLHFSVTPPAESVTVPPES